MAPSKRRTTIVLPLALLVRVSGAVSTLPASSVSGLIETALDEYLCGLERLRGAPFPPGLTPLRRGRRRGVKSDRDA